MTTGQKAILKHEIRLTGDGSPTLYVPSLDEHYHSHFGAVTESKHIFINAGLAGISSNHISILEAGFGTGLNALLTALYAAEHQVNVHYTALEKFPLGRRVTEQLGYGKFAGGNGPEIYSAIHDAPWGETVPITDEFMLNKIVCDLTTDDLRGKYDIIYFDAFGPDKQPDMWTEEVLGRVAAVTHPGSVFVTYSAKGTLKRILKTLGFDVTLLPGPPGKRVMTRAVKR